LRIDGQPVAHGKNFRTGHVTGMQGTDLVVFVRKESTQPVTFSFAPVRQE
jgi:hypothetical protein